MKSLVSLVLFAVCASAGLHGQVAVNDLFDRANGTSLGADWTEIDGDAVIQGGKLQANSPFTFGWCAHTHVSASYVDTVVRAEWSMNGPGGDRIALIAGVDPNTWQGIEIRIADNNGDGLADRIFFNRAVNAGTWYGGSLFHDLTTPLAAGTATLWFTNGGDTANVEIRNPATSLDETFTAGGILTGPPTGTTVGLGYFGNGTVEDFRAWTGVPTGVCYTLTAPRVGSAATFLVTDATANGLVALAYSPTGAGPQPSGIGTVFLSNPIDLLGIFPTDAGGRFELPLGVLPASLLGFTLHTQAADLINPTLSNGFSSTAF